MRNKIFATILAVLAVALYSVAVIDFCTGNVLDGIAFVLIACSIVLTVYALWRLAWLEEVLKVVGGELFGLLKALEKGVPATLTIRKADDDEITIDPDDEEEPEDEPDTDEELKREREAFNREIAEKSEKIAQLEYKLEKARTFIKDSLPETEGKTKWLPTIEQIKSVYAASGILRDNLYEYTDAENLKGLWEELKQLRIASGVDKTGGE